MVDAALAADTTQATGETLEQTGILDWQLVAQIRLAAHLSP